MRNGFVLMEGEEACVEENLSFLKKIGFTDVTVCGNAIMFHTLIVYLNVLSWLKIKPQRTRKIIYCTVSYLIKLILVSLHLKCCFVLLSTIF